MKNEVEKYANDAVISIDFREECNRILEWMPSDIPIASEARICFVSDHMIKQCLIANAGNRKLALIISLIGELSKLATCLNVTFAIDN